MTNSSRDIEIRETEIREIDRRDRSIAFAVIGLLLACYLLTFTGIIQSSDGLAMFATAESMARRGEIDSNQLLWMGNQQGNIGPDGELYSRKGLGMALLALPLVWFALLWRSIGLVHAALLLNPILTAWTGGLLFRSGRRLGWTRRSSVATALIFGLATLAWPYTQTFFSDPVCAFGLFGAFYGLLSYSQTARKRYLLLGSLAWSVAYLARVVNLVTLPLFALGLLAAIFAAAPVDRPDRAAQPRPTSWRDGIRSLFVDQWRPLVTAVLPVLLAGLLSLWWNWARYGSVWDSGYVETERFNGVWWFGVVGLLVGPSRGLIWYSPALLLAIGGVGWFWRHSRAVLAGCLALALVYVLLYGKWYMWHGGYSWGPRFLVPALPFLALLIGPVWERIFVHGRNRLAQGFVLVLIALSIALQWLGMLAPFGLVQDYLAQTVTPLFAPETFTQLRYSPLLLQWQFLSAEHVPLAWWRVGEGWRDLGWPGLLIPLTMLITSQGVLARRMRRPDEPPWQRPGGWLYAGALAAMMVALLLYYGTNLTAVDMARAGERIRQMEMADDAVLLLQPARTQDFANAYHGRLPVYGFFPEGELDPPLAQQLERLRTRYGRLWLIPDETLPEESGWERTLRFEDFLLLDTRLAEPDGQRLALYAMSSNRTLQEAGVGTIFGDPALADTGVTEENGWIRLDGYALTPETEPGGELLLALRWESLRPVDYDYQVFVHLLNANGEKLAQRDGQPVQWMRPTSSWQPGEELVDRYGLLLPRDLPQGSYTIAVGLYDPITGQRLPVSAGPRDYAIELGPILVGPD